MGNRPTDWHVLDLDDDPTPGDPERVKQLARELHDFADDVADALRQIKGMAGEDALLRWAGKTAKAFQDEFEEVPKNLKKLQRSYDLAGEALAAYWPKLERAQSLADKALAKGREARSDLTAANGRRDSADSWVERATKKTEEYDEKEGKDKPDEAEVRAATRNATDAKSAQSSAQRAVDNAESGLEAAKKMAADAKKMREDAASEAKDKLEEASDAGIQNRKWWEKAVDWVKDNWDTIVNVCKVIVAVLGIVVLIIGGPLAWVVLAAALVVLADTLMKYMNGEASLWDVAFAALDCIPGMKGLTTLGGLAKGLKGGLKAMKSLKGMKAAVLGLAKSGRGMLDDAAQGALNRLKSVVSKFTDPVDLATGQMYLPQTDIELPGILPLVFSRRLGSAYRAGWWFGPTWASTVDQRLETDERGVVFVTEDGRVIAYPHPVGPGAGVLPEHGPRWPMTRLESGGYTVADPLTGHTRRFSAPDRDGLCLIECISDRNGHTIDFAYDDDGAPTDIRHSGGYHLKLTTDAELGRITGLALASAADDGTDTVVKRFAYDPDGNLAEDINSSGLPLVFTYDHRLRVTSWTDRNGHRYDYTYDTRDRCIAEGGEAGHLVFTIDYDGTDPAWSDATVTTLTAADGAVSRFVVNDNCQITAEIDALGHTTRTEYDEHHHVISVTDALGHTTRFANDDAGRPVAVTYPDHAVSRFSYGETGLPETFVFPDGSGWSREYDARGNCVAATDAAGVTTRYTHDGDGRLTSITDPLGATTRIRCNAAGLVEELIDPLGNRHARSYDAFGRVVEVTDPEAATTRMRWTTEGRIAHVCRPDGTEQSWTYDGEGNCIRQVDGGGRVTESSYGPFDLLAARRGPDGVRHEFVHDPSLRLVGVVDPRGLTWDYTYDVAGRLIAESDFDGRRVTYEHDAVGRVLARENPLGQRVTYAYDALGRLVAKNADGEVTSYEWDALGRMTRAESPEYDLRWQWDDVGRVVTEAVDGHTMYYGYDLAGRRVKRSTPAGVVTAYEWDAAGRPAAVRTAGHTVTYSHDAVGRETSRGLRGAASLEQRWDTSGRLVEQHIAAADGTVQSSRSYAYGADNQLTGMTDPLLGEVGYELDTAGRVTAVRAQDWSETYAYDDAGNQARASWPAFGPEDAAQGERTYAGNTLVGAGGGHYEYDAAGRVVLRRRSRLSRKADIWRYEWDAEDRLTSVTTPDGTRWGYRYDPFGRRIAKLRYAADGTTVLEEIRFTWDGFNLAEQTTTTAGMSAAVTLSWEHDGVRPVSQTELLTDEATHEVIDARFYSIVTGLIGAPTELVDEEGNVAWRARRTLWGLTSWQVGGDAYTPLRFPGQYHDHETGLHYNVHRYYDPETARYLSVDPLGLLPGPNPSAYVANPEQRCDPLGLAPCRPDVMNIFRGPSQGLPGGQLGPPVSINQVRMALGRRGMSVSDYDIVHIPEINGPLGPAFGNSPHTADGFPMLGPNGRPLIEISDIGLRSMDEAVSTIFHEIHHHRLFETRRGTGYIATPGDEDAAEAFGRQMLDQFHRRGRQ